MKSLWQIAMWVMPVGGLMWLTQAFAQDTGTAGPPREKEAQREFRVRYVTPDAVYFNGGTVLGVRAGDKVWVSRNLQKLVQLEVKYVSEHSASCLLETGDAPAERQPVLQVDDVVLWQIPMPEFQKRMRPPAEPAPRAPAPVRNKAPLTSFEPRRIISARRAFNNRLNGQLSFQSFGQKDRGQQQFDFFESSAYLRLNFERPGGLPVRLLTRMRASQNYQAARSASLQSRISRYRVYELALEYDTPKAPLEFAVGRMLRHELRGVGYLDGMALGYRLKSTWKAGVFYGTQPDLYDYSVRLEEQKIGAFVQARPMIGKKAEFTLAATGIGQYRRGQISREYLATEIGLSFARQWFVTQYLEIDLNRAWRRAASASALTMSNAYFNTSYYPSALLSFGLSYDARRLLRTWETRTLADSLFDQNLRQGWRANIAVQPTTMTRFAIDGGWQGQKNSPEVYSAGISASATNFVYGLSLNVRLSYFGNSLSSGYYPSLDLSRSFFGVVYATLGGGAYVYRVGNGMPSQTNPWERIRLDFNLARRFYLSSTFENYHGDTMRFVRGFADLGWRF